MGTGIMVLLLLHVLTVTWILGCVAGDAHAPCCTQKTVGGVSYILVKEGDTSNYNCLTNCMYTKETGGPLYCFAAGDLEVECGDSSVTTEIPGGSDDEVTARVKGYIDTNTCNVVTYSSEYSETDCGDNGQSYYKEFIYNNKRVVVSNGMPDHPAESDPLQTNPNVRCPGWQFIQLPIDPAKGSTVTDTSLGTIGLAVTGGAFFNDLSNPDGSLALPNEGPSLDSCLGHSAPAGGPGGGGPPGGGGGPPGGGGGPRPPPPGRRIKRQEDTPHAGRHHYHGNLNCTNAGAATGAGDPDTCLLLGYYRDGVPVYGFCKDNTGMMMTSCYKTSAVLTTTVTVSGTYETAASNSDYTYTPDANCNLDEASGALHPTTGQYSYFMTTGYPWIPIKYYGDQGTTSYCSAQ